MAVFPLELFEEWDFILAGAHRCQARWQHKTAPDRKDVGRRLDIIKPLSLLPETPTSPITRSIFCRAAFSPGNTR